MKKIFKFLSGIFCFLFLLVGCVRIVPACELKVSANETSVSYELSFKGTTKSYEGYEVEVFKGENLIKEERNDFTVTKGTISGLAMNTEYTMKVSLYDGDKVTDVTSKPFTTSKGKITGVSFNDGTFVYDGTVKSIAVENVPNGANVVYDNNDKVDVGTYEVTAKVLLDNYEDLILKANLVITKQDVTFALESKTVTYNGQKQELTATGDLPLTYEYYDGETKLADAPVNVGTYKVLAIFAGDENKEAKTLEATLTINKATYDMSGVTFEDKTVTYDGTEHELVVTGTLPEGVSVSYTTNKLTDVGSVEVTASFTGNENYEPIASKTATLTVTKATHNMNDVLFDNKTVTYDGSEQNLTVKGTLPTGVTVAYEYYDGETKLDNAPVNVGTYKVVATFSASSNYEVITSKEATLTITKAMYDMSNVTFTDETVTYDGTEHELVVSGTLPEGVSVTYTTNKLTNVGSVEVTASFTGSTNYEPIASKTATLTVVKATHDMSGVTFEDLVVTYDGTEHELVVSGTLPEGVTVTYTTNKLTDAGSLQVTASFSVDELNYNEIEDKTANLIINKATYDMSGVTLEDKTVTYDGTEHELVISGTLPTGVTVTYTTNKLTNPGSVEVTASFTGNANYEEIASKTAVLTVNKVTVTLSSSSIEVEVGESYEVSYTCSVDDDSLIEIEYKNQALETITKPTAVGRYYAVVTFVGNDIYEAVSTTITIVIKDPTFVTPTIEMDTVTVTYKEVYNPLPYIDGYSYDAAYFEISYEQNGSAITPVNAGIYDVIVKFLGDTTNKLNPKEEVFANGLIIEQATMDLSGVTYTNEYTYDGTAHSIVAHNVPEGVDVTYYPINSLDVAGSIQVTISFNAGNNYNGIAPVYLNLIVHKAQVNEPGANANLVYNGSELTGVTVEEDDLYTVEGNVKMDAGTYEAVLTLKDEENYEWASGSDGVVSFTIEKATYDMSGVTLEDKTVTYDGNEHELLITGTLPEGVSVSYTTNKLTDVGSVEVTASFTGNSNYNEIASMQATLTINKVAGSPENDGIETEFIIAKTSEDQTIADILDVLEAHNYTVNASVDLTKVLLVNTPEVISVTYISANTNYLPNSEVEVTVTLKVLLTSVSASDDGRQVTGAVLSKDNLIVKAHFSDGTEEVVESSKYTVAAETTIISSATQVTVTFEELTCNVTVTPITPQIMIYAVYGAGGNSGASYTNDFFILYNPTNEDVDISGWTLFYTKSNGEGVALNEASSFVITNTIIKAKSFVTILGKAGTSVTNKPLPFAEEALVSSIDAAGTNGILTLATTKDTFTFADLDKANVSDMVGYGSASTYEGDLAAPALGKTHYIARVDKKDTNKNSNDFSTVDFLGTSSDFLFLEKEYEAYLYAKDYFENEGISLTLLGEGTLELPTTYNGISISWSILNELEAGIFEIEGSTVTYAHTGSSTIEITLVADVNNTTLGKLEYDVTLSAEITLTTPNVTLTHTTLSWTKDSNSEEYSIYLGSDETPIKVLQTSSYEGNTITFDLLSLDDFDTLFSVGSSTEIKVKADSSHNKIHESELSAAQTFNVADTSDLDSLNAETIYLFKVVVLEQGKYESSKTSLFVKDVVSSAKFVLYSYPGDLSALEAGDIIYVSGEYLAKTTAVDQIQNATGYTKTNVKDINLLSSIDTAKELADSDLLSTITLTGVTANSATTVTAGSFNYPIYCNEYYVSDASITLSSQIREGATFDLYGVVTRYNSTLQITVIDISNFVIPNSVKINATKEEVLTYVENTNFENGQTITLPLTGTEFSEVEISYAIGETVLVDSNLEDNVFTFVLDEEVGTEVLTYTLTIEGETPVEYNINVTVTVPDTREKIVYDFTTSTYIQDNYNSSAISAEKLTKLFVIEGNNLNGESLISSVEGNNVFIGASTDERLAIKLGSSNKTGNFTLTLSEIVRVGTIKVDCAVYGTDESKLVINTIEQDAPATRKILTYELGESATNVIELSTSGKRVKIYGITFYYETITISNGDKMNKTKEEVEKYFEDNTSFNKGKEYTLPLQGTTYSDCSISYSYSIDDGASYTALTPVEDKITFGEQIVDNSEITIKYTIELTGETPVTGTVEDIGILPKKVLGEISVVESDFTQVSSNTNVSKTGIDGATISLPGFTLKSVGSGTVGSVNANNDELRVYKESSIVISSESLIVSVEIKYTNSEYASTAQVLVGETPIDEPSSTSEGDYVVKVYLINSNNFTIKNTGTTQVRMKHVNISIQ